jgi:hypothetical protein
LRLQSRFARPFSKLCSRNRTEFQRFLLEEPRAELLPVEDGREPDPSRVSEPLPLGARSPCGSLSRRVKDLPRLGLPPIGTPHLSGGLASGLSFGLRGSGE